MRELHQESLPAAFTGVAALSLSFVIRQFFRPYLLAHFINDHAISRWMPSFFFVTGLSMLLMVFRRYRFEIVPILVTIGTLVYQMGHYVLTGIPDRESLVATLLAGGFALFVAFQYFEPQSAERINR